MAEKLRGLTLLIFIFFLLLAAGVPAVNSQPNAWINEFHYDNDGSDTGEFVEVAVEDPESWDLSQLTLTLYNGSGGVAYGSHTLDSFVEGGSSGNFTVYSRSIAGIQNGTDGLSLDYNESLIQFISYEGSLTATEGPASGETSLDIGINETASSPAGESLQLTGTGLNYDDFFWTGPAGDSPGYINSGQILHPTVQFVEGSRSVDEDHGSVTIAVSIAKPDGNAVSVDVAFQTAPSSSVAADFAGPVTKTISFAAGAADGATKSVSFDINDDSDYEGEEQAIFTLAHLNTFGNAQINSPSTFRLTVTDNDEPDVVINEILADPDGDIDGNGSTNGTSDDEFIEILNNEAREVDLSGWSFSDNGSNIRHTFSAGTILPASGALVLFSKDDDGQPVGVFGGSVLQTSDLSLSLNNNGDFPTLRDAGGNVIDSYDYGSEGGNNESLVRDPDGSGEFVAHSSASGSGGSSSSPGTRIDGTNFTTSITIQGRAGWRMLSAPVVEMTIADLMDDTPIQGYANYNPVANKNFYVGYDGTAFSEAGDLDNDELNPGHGFILYFFNNTRGGSIDLPVTLDVTTGKEHTADVNVTLHSAGDGWNLLGNPFETAIDISGIASWVKGGSLQSSVGYIWDNASRSYILTTSINDKISAWQGFFIQNNDATGMEMPISAKATGTRYYKDAAQVGHLALTLNGTNTSTGEKTTDKATVLYFHPEASHEWDRFDASKLVPLTNNYAILNIISTRDNNRVVKAQDSRPYNFEGELSYDLQLVTQGASGQFELSWAKENLPDTWTFTLIDNETGTQVDMNSTDTYTFEYDKGEKRATAADQSESEMEHISSGALTAKPKSGEDPRFTVKVTANSRTEESGEIPESVKLNQNYPNPFNPSTTISFELAEQAEVALSVYTIVGQKVATLVDGALEAGVHREVWNASEMPSGIYIAQLEVNGRVFIRKMTLIK